MRTKLALRPLIRKLDKVFSEYIRRRDAVNGYASCFTCGTARPWKEMHAGHYVNRDRMNTRWEEQNVHVQCPSCNTFHEGRKPEYTLFLQGRYGPDIIEKLVRAGKQVKRWDATQLRALIHYYQDKLKEMGQG